MPLASDALPDSTAYPGRGPGSIPTTSSRIEMPTRAPSTAAQRADRSPLEPTAITRGKEIERASSGLVRTTATEAGILSPGRRLSVAILRSRKAPARSA